jgi:hypothetical protein
MAENRTPVPNPTTSFWTAETLPFSNLRSTQDLPTSVDVVIIGAGFAGIARLLASA